MTNKPRYILEDEKILEYMKLSIEDRLQWLEDALEFNQLAFTEKDKRIRELLKDEV